ncbi:MAG TPA: amino acid permease, partial [Mycobacterium sp.]|nr:amino acid permease [Mycobacterium sp.]
HQALEPEGRRHQVLRRKFVPFLGLLGCLVLAVFLPVSSVLVGAAVVAIGAAAYVVTAPGRPASGS